MSTERSTAVTDLDQLRGRRTHLLAELQGVQYWRRVARAESDLLVADLLYGDHEDLVGLHGVATMPGTRGRRAGTGERLEVLRERERRLRGQEQALREDLDTVTRELLDRVLPRQGTGRRSAADRRPTATATRRPAPTPTGTPGAG